jgi:hypothetical protein
VTDFDRLIDSLTRAPTLGETPSVVSVLDTPPVNPPMSIQERFTGATGKATYREAAKFVGAARGWSERYAGAGFEQPVLDFGAGWGRITRFLLAHLPATSVYALDVDPAMTALTQVTLPGVQSLTVPPYPPAILRDGAAGTITAFSVFSHLSAAAHEAWSAEFARLLRRDGFAFITVLDQGFLKQLRDDTAVTLGHRLSDEFGDIAEAEAQFKRGELVYAASGGGGVLAPDFYGWAVAPRPYVEATWGRVGLDVIEWVPAGALFGQAMVGLRKR